MIVARCANGVVLFKVQLIKGTDFLEWFCLNDSSTGQQPRTGAGFEQFVRDMATKANSLRGAVQQVVDLPEIN
jgi:hypothetical protein